MSEYVVELDGKHSIALKLAFIEEACGGDFIRGEIVRCRDCKLRSTYSENEYERISVCRRIASNYRVRDDDFCSWGERKTINKTGDIVTHDSGATGGTLTAEQVRKAIFNGSSYASYDGAQYYANGIDMQAIADELNSRAERTCECVAEYAKSPIDGKTIVLHRCSACHELMRPHMLYCPNCGAKVVGE